MRHGKDVMVDKPGVITLDELAEVRRVQAETGRIFSVCYSERFENRATAKASRARRGRRDRHASCRPWASGPHALRNNPRPDWFFQRRRYGGILCDIAAHQCDQFLHFTGSTRAEVVASHIANHANPDTPELEDFGEVLLRGNGGTGYIRVDWYTPEGPAACGATGGSRSSAPTAISSCASTSTSAGRPGGDHLFLVDGKGTQHIDCSDRAVALRPAPDRRRAEPHRDRDAPGTLLPGHRTRAEGRGDGHRGWTEVMSSQLARRRGRARRRRQAPARPMPRSPGLFEVKAVCDLTPDKLRATAAEFGVAWHDGVAAPTCLPARSIDLIDLCTPPNTHRGLIEQALAAGFHVICEKPLIGSLADVDAVAAAQRAARGTLSPIFQYRFGNGLQKAQALAGQGLCAPRANHDDGNSWRRDGDYYAIQWRGKWATETGRLLPHPGHPRA